MSPARRSGAGEESILASLERSASRRLGARRAPRTNIAWLAGGGTVVLLLTALLAWLAYSNVTRVRVLPVTEGRQPAQAAQAGIMLARHDAPAATAAAIVDVPPAPDAPAAIRDEAPPARAAESAPARKPMVMLAPDQAAAAKAAPASAPVPAPAPVPARAETVIATPPHAPAPKAVAAVPKPAQRPSSAAPLKKARTAPVAKPAEPEVIDTDVALISAIVAHASSHAAERAQQEAAACAAGKKCPPRPASEP